MSPFCVNKYLQSFSKKCVDNANTINYICGINKRVTTMNNMDTELVIGIGLFLLITIGPAVGYGIAAIIAKLVDKYNK